MAILKHVEIAGVDGEQLEAFYSELFDWKIKRRDEGGFAYGEVYNHEKPSVGFRHEPEGKAELVIYVEVDDLETSVKTAQSLGAKVRIPPMQYGQLSFALIEDPEGNAVGLTQA